MKWQPAPLAMLGACLMAPPRSAACRAPGSLCRPRGSAVAGYPGTGPAPTPPLGRPPESRRSPQIFCGTRFNKSVSGRAPSGCAPAVPRLCWPSPPSQRQPRPLQGDDVWFDSGPLSCVGPPGGRPSCKFCIRLHPASRSVVSLARF